MLIVFWSAKNQRLLYVILLQEQINRNLAHAIKTEIVIVRDSEAEPCEGHEDVSQWGETDWWQW